MRQHLAPLHPRRERTLGAIPESIAVSRATDAFLGGTTTRFSDTKSRYRATKLRSSGTRTLCRGTKLRFSATITRCRATITRCRATGLLCSDTRTLCRATRLRCSVTKSRYSVTKLRFRTMPSDRRVTKTGKKPYFWRKWGGVSKILTILSLRRSKNISQDPESWLRFSVVPLGLIILALYPYIVYI